MIEDGEQGPWRPYMFLVWKLTPHLLATVSTNYDIAMVTVQLKAAQNYRNVGIDIGGRRRIKE